MQAVRERVGDAPRTSLASGLCVSQDQKADIEKLPGMGNSGVRGWPGSTVLRATTMSVSGPDLQSLMHYEIMPLPFVNLA